MKAVVMAGGEGTRLRAVTGTLPKPLAPLLGRPIMEHILLLLRSYGVEEVCASLRYGAEEIRRAFGDGESLGLRLAYRVEERPLGTAGGVKNCADFIGGEDVLVISGDAVCDFDLGLLMRRHRESGAAVTLALSKQASPLRYGLAVTDGDGRVRSFVEKPAWPRVVTDLVNTGIYVVSPRALALVPKDSFFDFAKDLFPLLLEKGETLLGVPLEGYWCDAGTPLSYYQCCVDALEGRLKLDVPPAFLPQATADEVLPDEGADAALDCPCRSRAALMGALSELMLELDADYADGIRLTRENFSLHIAPLCDTSAVRVAVRAEDAEFARALAFSAREIITALGL